jgi:hypothetical protein
MSAWYFLNSFFFRNKAGKLAPPIASTGMFSLKRKNPNAGTAKLVPARSPLGVVSDH